MNLPALPKIIPEGTGLAHAVREYARTAVYESQAQAASLAFPLPQPASGEKVYLGHGDYEEIAYYTADQMRAHAVEAARLERDACAKLCDEFGDEYMQQARGGDRSGASDHKACAATEIADLIRSRTAVPAKETSHE